MRPVVFDASAVLGALLRPGFHGGLVEVLADSRNEAVVPHLCDVEVASSLRRVVRTGESDTHRAREALSLYRALPLRRFPHTQILERVFELQDNFTAYDAIYVALAEGLDACLVTLDERLARAVRDWTTVPLLDLPTP